MCLESNELAIRYDRYQVHKNSPGKDRWRSGGQMSLQLGTTATKCIKTLQLKFVEEWWSKNFADYKCKYFNRHHNSAKKHITSGK